MAKVKPLRTLSFYPWLEKLWIIVDCLQIFGLFWNLSQAWGIPHVYVEWTRMLVWFNLDYFSTTEMGALMGRSNFLNLSKWGEMDGYFEYSLFFVFPVFIVYMLYIFLLFKASEYGVDYVYRLRMWIDAALLFLAQLLYVPICLAVSRIYVCEDAAVSVDPNIECLDSHHVTFILIGTLVVFPLYIGLPVYVYMKSARSIVYDFHRDHEKWLIGREFLYMFDLDNYLIKTQLWNVASFRKCGVWHRFQMLLIKSLLILSLTVLRSQLYLQSSLCALLISVFTLMMLIMPPYRLFSSNLVVKACFSALSVNFIFGYLNTTGLESALTVGSAQASILTTINLFMFLIVTTLLARDIFSSHSRWLPYKALHRINKGPIPADVKKWISTMRKADNVLFDCFEAPDETVDLGELEMTGWDVRQCWLHAREHGSVFEHLLNEYLEKMLLLHARRNSTALRKLCPQWDDEYKKARSKLRRKADSYRFLNRTKRIILYKLMAITFILGERKISRASAQTRHEIDELQSESNGYLATLSDKSIGDNMRQRIRQSLLERWNLLIVRFENKDEDDEFFSAFSERDLCEWLEYRNKLS